MSISGLVDDILQVMVPGKSML